MTITWQTPLTTIPWHPDLDMRRVMVANALSVLNVEAADPRTRPIFDDLLGPPIGGWGLDKPYGAGGVSTCSMVALGLLRRLGVDCPDILDGYADDIGSGLRVARNWARSLLPRPAWITPIPGLRPDLGSVIDLKPRPHAKDRSNHTEVVVGWEQRDQTLMVVCVAGGQVGARGLQAIHLVRRPWVERDGTSFSGGREADGWIAVDLLPYSGPVVVPEGWERVEV